MLPALKAVNLIYADHLIPECTVIGTESAPLTTDRLNNFHSSEISNAYSIENCKMNNNTIKTNVSLQVMFYWKM